MAPLYADFVLRVLRLIDDPDQNLTDDTLVWVGVVGAHDAILPWVPKLSQTTISSGSDGLLFALPADLYQIQAVQLVETGVFLPKANILPNSARGNTAKNDWLDYPTGYISLSNALVEDAEIMVFYLAHWGKPENEQDTDFMIEVPPYAHQGLIYYAGSHCLTPRAVTSASIRQFNQRIDSGNPEDNPLKIESRNLRDLFYQEMKMMPPYAKVPHNG
jgi:hypothetical protein